MPFGSGLRRVRRYVTGDTPVANDLVRPVLANLATAFLLFLSVALLKDPIYRLLAPKKSVVDYPLYCIAEGYNEAAGNLAAELYIFNKRADSLTEAKLIELLQARQSQNDDSPVDPSIRLNWIGGSGHILAVEEDREFNRGKGELDIRPHGGPGEGEWVIRVREILGKGVLRLRIATDSRRPINRAAKASLPFEIAYSGD